MKPAVVVFDLFGTLLDIGSLRDAASSVTDEPDAFVATWREKQIAYTFASVIMQTHENFDAMTAHALRYAAQKYGVALDQPAQRRLVNAWCELRAYADAVPALSDLRARGVPCAVLTNGTPKTSAAALARAGLEELLDASLSVESAGVFKPDRRVYALVTARYQVAAAEVIFVSSNGWDATGAAAFGMRVAWCNRFNAAAETFGPPPAWTIRDLHGLAAVLEER